jgi:hypothetical protein
LDFEKLPEKSGGFFVVPLIGRTNSLMGGVDPTADHTDKFPCRVV